MIAALLVAAVAWAGEAVTYDRLFGPEAPPVAAEAPAVVASGDALADLGETEAPAVPNWIWPAGIGAMGLFAASRLRQPTRLTTPPAVQVVTRQSLGDKAALIVVEVTDADGDRRRLLVGTGAGAPALVADLGQAQAAEPAVAAASPARSTRFVDSLDALLPQQAPAPMAGHAAAAARVRRAPAPPPPSYAAAARTALPRPNRIAPEDILDTPAEPVRVAAPRSRALAAFEAHGASRPAPARVEVSASRSPAARAQAMRPRPAQVPVVQAPLAEIRPAPSRLSSAPPPARPRMAGDIVRAASAPADAAVLRGQALVDQVLAERRETTDEENPFLAEATRLGLAC
jgi:hypothetical protein